MAMSKEAQVASLYNLKSVVDGMISCVRGDVITLDKSLEVVAKAAMDISEKNIKSNAPGD